MEKSSILALVVLLSPPAVAETCGDLKTCAKLMHDLKGQVYFWEARTEDFKFGSAPSIEMTKETAELVFTAMLDHAGLARLPVGDGKTYRVVRNLMLKEIEAPVVEASSEKAPEFPSNTWDWVTMRYKVKQSEAAPVIESSYRLHVTREGRMQADENAGLLLVTGPIPMVRQMYQTIKAADRPLSAQAKKRYEEWRKATFAPKPSPEKSN